MTTKHHIVGHAGKLSKEQLEKIEADYERDLADNAKTAALTSKSAAAKADDDGEGDETGE
jgi:hypothetical protein